MSTLFNHVGLQVRDIDKSLSFYCDMLDFKLCYRKKMDTSNLTEVFFLRKENFELELLVAECDVWLERPKGRFRGVPHIAFFVDDIEKEIERFEQAGFVCTVPLFFPDIDVPGEEKYKRAVYFSGPDGEAIEFRGP